MVLLIVVLVFIITRVPNMYSGGHYFDFYYFYP